MRRRSTRLLLVVTALAGVSLASCGRTPLEAARPSIIDLGRDAGAGVTPIDQNRTNVLDAGHLRLMFEELLGVHGALTMQMMRQAEQQSPTLDSWIDGLAGNTAELSGAIGLASGRTRRGRSISCGASRPSSS